MVLRPKCLKLDTCQINSIDQNMSLASQQDAVGGGIEVRTPLLANVESVVTHSTQHSNDSSKVTRFRSQRESGTLAKDRQWGRKFI